MWVKTGQYRPFGQRQSARAASFFNQRLATCRCPLTPRLRNQHRRSGSLHTQVTWRYLGDALLELRPISSVAHTGSLSAALTLLSVLPRRYPDVTSPSARWCRAVAPLVPQHLSPALPHVRPGTLCPQESPQAVGSTPGNQGCCEAALAVVRASYGSICGRQNGPCGERVRADKPASHQNLRRKAHKNPEKPDKRTRSPWPGFQKSENISLITPNSPMIDIVLTTSLRPAL